MDLVEESRDWQLHAALRPLTTTDHWNENLSQEIVHLVATVDADLEPAI